ncbi:uncharacterized protein LOC100176012 [Ciona intestinalis]
MSLKNLLLKKLVFLLVHIVFSKPLTSYQDDGDLLHSISDINATQNIPTYDDARSSVQMSKIELKPTEQKSLSSDDRNHYLTATPQKAREIESPLHSMERWKRSLEDIDILVLDSLNSRTGLKMTTEDYEQLSPQFRSFLRSEVNVVSHQRSGRGLQVRTSLSISVNVPHFFYQEDSGPAGIINNPVQIDAPTGIEFVLIESLNILDTDREILALSSFTQTVTVDTGTRNVTFSYVITPSFTFDESAGVLNLTGLLSVSEYEHAIATLTYDNTAEEPTAQFRGLNVEVHDATSSANVPIYFTVQNVNDSPFFGSKPPVLTIEEDGSLYAPISSTAINILGNSITDNDFNSELAIGILGADNTNGLWRYPGPSHTLVTVEDGVRDASGNILRNTSLSKTCVVLNEQYLGYTPNSNYVGNTTITVVAWDKTGTTSSFLNGDFVNVTWTAPGDAFSPDMATVTVMITPVNDAPHVALTSSQPIFQLTTVAEDSDGGSGIRVSKLTEACDDVDMAYDSTILNLGIAVTSFDNSGTWQRTSDNGTTWTDISSVSVLLGSNGDAESDGIRLIPNANFNGEASFTYTCWDFTSGTNGKEGVDASYIGPTGAFSQQEVTGIVEVSNTNDSPYFQSGISSVELPVHSASALNMLGTTVKDLVKDVYRDIDPTTNLGVAVINTDSSLGEFEYTCSVTSPNEWFSFYSSYGAGQTSPEPVSTSLATVLSSTCRIRVAELRVYNSVNNLCLLPKGTIKENECPVLPHPTKRRLGLPNRFLPDTSFTSASHPHIDILPWDGSDELNGGSFRVNAAYVPNGSFGPSFISVVATMVENSFPSLSGSQGEVQFYEGGNPVSLFPDIFIWNMTSSRGATSRVSLYNIFDTGYERIVIGSSDGYASLSELTSSSGLSATWNIDYTEVIFAGNISEGFYEKALRSVGYQHSSQNPTTNVGPTDSRRVEVVVTDISGVSSPVFSRNLKVTSVNNAPMVSTSYEATSTWTVVDFRRGSDPVPLFSAVNFTFSDPDDTSLNSVILSINPVYDGSNEMLYIPSSFERMFYVNDSYYYIKILTTSSEYNVTSGVLKYSITNHDANFQDYSAAMREITYSNTADPPDFRHREVYMFGSDHSNAVTPTTTISINMLEANGSTVIDLPIGNLPGSPAIQQVVAYPAVIPSIQRTTVQQHTDAKFSSGDRIQIVFDRDTNMPPFGYYDTTDPVASAGKTLTKHEILEIFSFTNPLVVASIDGYTGRWLTARIFEITVVREGYPQLPVQIGNWATTPKQTSICDNVSFTAGSYCIRDITGLSKPSAAASPPLEGNWGLNVPNVTDVVLQNSTLQAGVEYVTDGTTGHVSLRPAMSKSQLDQLCSVFFSGILESDIANELPGLTAVVSQCQNNYVARWDLSLDKTDQVPTETQFTLTFHTSVTDYTVHQVISYLTTRYSKSVVIDVVSQDTGVSRTALEGYRVAERLSTNVYVEQNDNLTPALLSAVITHQDTSKIDDISIQIGDVITLQFDKATNEPNVSTKAEIDTVFSFNNHMTYVGNWISDSTLTITITSFNDTVTSLSGSFRLNQLADGTTVTDTSNVNCVGLSVCGLNNVSVGICDTTTTSCRAHGTFTLTHTTQPNNTPVIQVGGIDWWWLLLVGLLLLFCTLIIIFLLRKRKKKHTEDKDKGTYDEYRSIPTSTTTRTVTPDILAWTNQDMLNRNNFTSNKYRRKSNTTNSPFNGRVAPSPIYSVSSKTLSRDVRCENADVSSFGEVNTPEYERKVRFANDDVTDSKPVSPSALQLTGRPDLLGNSVASTYRSNEQNVMEILSHVVFERPVSVTHNTEKQPRDGSTDNPEENVITDDSFQDVRPVLHELSTVNNGVKLSSKRLGTPTSVQEKSASLPGSSSTRDSSYSSRRTASDTDDSTSYVPSFAPSISSTSRSNSKSATSSDPSSETSHSSKSQHSHRASISGLPMTWYVACGNEDSSSIAAAQLRRSMSNTKEGIEKAEVIWE